MSQKIAVGVLGATGMVGQNYIQLLAHHPWFEVTYVAASPKSAGMRYSDAIQGRSHCGDIPKAVGGLAVQDANDVEKARGRCSVVFSALDLDKRTVAALEEAYAAAGFAVVSNNSAHRQTADVPMIIPEVNPHHLELIQCQRRRRNWSSGLIVVKSNCSIQSYMTPLYALLKGGFTPTRMIVTTLQALSGAGYPGPSGLDILDNIVPYIPGEEEKSETEPLKILGTLGQDRIQPASFLTIAAHCNRVAVLHGHTACVSIGFEAGKKPCLEEIQAIWNGFSSEVQQLELPSAPRQPIIFRQEQDRPQPHKDRDADKAMAVTVGRLRPCPVLDYRFVGLHHNAIRGAAGGAILTAELLKVRGYIQ
ncbi:MAG: aspartate-semialdehyde dehydrogenase [Chitinivibrionales bacterium]|nr:aspartate-semialdehyde dehydrogenase [Chitinivibrionales bacterium]